VVFEDEINMDFVNEVEKESDFKAYWGNWDIKSYKYKSINKKVFYQRTNKRGDNYVFMG
jgi:hypothetical protein